MTSKSPRNPQIESLILSIESLEDRCMLAADVYEPGQDAQVGFNMVSFVREGRKAGKQHWVDGVQSMVDAGATQVTLAVYREVRGGSGKVKRGTGPRYSVIEAAAEHAQSLGMQVTINPLFEVSSPDGWRGDWNPVGKDAAKFQRSYQKYVGALTKIASDTNADRLNIGSELVAFVNNPDNHQYLNDLIDDLDSQFDGQLGYVANWSNFDSAHLATAVWEHEAIDYLGVSAYFSATYSIGHEIVDVATANNPGADLVAAAEAGWDDIFDNYLIPVAASVHDGELPIVIQEFGAVPFNLAGANPWSTTPSETATGNPGETADPQEQHDIFKGLLRSLDGRQEDIASVDFWTWSFESSQYDLFALDARPRAVRHSWRQI